MEKVSFVCVSSCKKSFCQENFNFHVLNYLSVSLSLISPQPWFKKLLVSHWLPGFVPTSLHVPRRQKPLQNLQPSKREYHPQLFFNGNGVERNLIEKRVRFPIHCSVAFENRSTRLEAMERKCQHINQVNAGNVVR